MSWKRSCRSRRGGFTVRIRLQVSYLGGGLSVSQTLREAGVGVGAVRVGLGGVLEGPPSGVGHHLLLQAGAGARPLPDGRRGAGLGHVGALGPLVVLVPQAAVAPLAVGVVDLLAVEGGAGRRAHRRVAVVLAGRAAHRGAVVAAGAHATPHRGRHLVGRAAFALQVGVVVRRQLAVVRLLRHGVRVEGAADEVRVAILLGEAVVAPHGPVAVHGEAGLPGIQREVPAGRVQVTGVAGVVVVESILLGGGGVAPSQGLGADPGLMEAGRTLLPQGVGARHRDVVELLQEAVDGGVLGRPVAPDDGLRGEQTALLHHQNDHSNPSPHFLPSQQISFPFRMLAFILTAPTRRRGGGVLVRGATDPLPPL